MHEFINQKMKINLYFKIYELGFLHLDFFSFWMSLTDALGTCL